MANSEKPKFKCEFCAKEYKFEKRLLTHDCVVKKPKPKAKRKCKTQCKACEQKFTTEEEFLSHNCPEAINNLCKFCKKVFLTEKALAIHMCEKKRRWFDKDTKYVRYGFLVFQKFYEMNHLSKKPRTYEQFVESKFYAAFTAFGRYLLTINAINPSEFINFVIKSGLKMDEWQKEYVYQTYVRELNKKETPTVAIERTLLLADQWARDNDENFIDFFRKISPALATQWIISGRISPWILFATSCGEKLVNRLSPEQYNLVNKSIDSVLWLAMIEKESKEVIRLREAFDAEGF